MAERDGNNKSRYKFDVEDFLEWVRFFLALLMKYEGANEAIQVAISAIESAEVKGI